MLALAFALSILIGISLGLLGGGGSILTVPILAYVLGLEPKHAIATSLLVVGITSAVAMISHARAGRVHFRTGIVFGVAGMAGAFAAGRVAAKIPGSWLLLGFAGVMVLAGSAMVRGRKEAPGNEESVVSDLPIPRVLAQGALVGVVSGLVGAGGGFLIVPALVLLGGMPIEAAIGTSLLVIAMQSIAGFLGHVGHVSIDVALAAVVTGAAVLGSFAGKWLSTRLDAKALRKGFGWFVLVMAVVVVGKQAAPIVAEAPLAELARSHVALVALLAAALGMALGAALSATWIRRAGARV